MGMSGYLHARSASPENPVFAFATDPVIREPDEPPQSVADPVIREPDEPPQSATDPVIREPDEPPQSVADSVIREPAEWPRFTAADRAADAGDTIGSGVPKPASAFKPNPKTAYLMAFVFPGFGQAYNRQYWKLPIVYGGLMGCAYAVTWNNKTYQDYKSAYFDIVADAKNDPSAQNPDSWSQSWQNYVPSSRDKASMLHDATFRENLKRNKDYFRRYRDLSIIVTFGVYLLCVADTYVDAQMFDFDIGQDLSFRVTPMFTPETLSYSRSLGLHVCMTF
jgi:hypothetical protein